LLYNFEVIKLNKNNKRYIYIYKTQKSVQMSQICHLRKVLTRLEHASNTVTRKYPYARYLIPQQKQLNNEEDLVKQINKHITFLENRELSHIMFRCNK
jgi:hypothetical protein